MQKMEEKMKDLSKAYNTLSDHTKSVKITSDWYFNKKLVIWTQGSLWIRIQGLKSISQLKDIGIRLCQNRQFFNGLANNERKNINSRKC